MSFPNFELYDLVKKHSSNEEVLSSIRRLPIHAQLLPNVQYIKGIDSSVINLARTYVRDNPPSNTKIVDLSDGDFDGNTAFDTPDDDDWAHYPDASSSFEHVSSQHDYMPSSSQSQMKQKSARSRSRTQKTYIPKPASASAAILIALYIYSREQEKTGSKPWLSKKELMSRARHYTAVPLAPSMENMYGGWASVTQHIAKGLIYAEGTPRRYTLTPEGFLPAVLAYVAFKQREGVVHGEEHCGGEDALITRLRQAQDNEAGSSPLSQMTGAARVCMEVGGTGCGQGKRKQGVSGNALTDPYAVSAALCSANTYPSSSHARPAAYSDAEDSVEEVLAGLARRAPPKAKTSARGDGSTDVRGGASGGVGIGSAADVARRLDVPPATLAPTALNGDADLATRARARMVTGLGVGAGAASDSGTGMGTGMDTGYVVGGATSPLVSGVGASLATGTGTGSRHTSSRSRPPAVPIAPRTAHTAEGVSSAVPPPAGAAELRAPTASLLAPASDSDSSSVPPLPAASSSSPLATSPLHHPFSNACRCRFCVLPPAAVRFVPSEYDIGVVVDNREVYQGVARADTSRTLFSSLLAQQPDGMLCYSGVLAVGDMLWVARRRATGEMFVLDCIVERKRTSDLIGSIKDGRYREQRLRLQRTGLSRVCYVVEGPLLGEEALPLMGRGSASGAVDTGALLTVLCGLQGEAGFFVQHTMGSEDTRAFLTRLHAHVRDYYVNEEQKTYVHPCVTAGARVHHSRTGPEDEPFGPAEGSLPHYPDFYFGEGIEGAGEPLGRFQLRMRKKSHETAAELFARQLKQVRGVAAAAAAAIAERYKSCAALLKAYLSAGLGSDRARLMLADLPIVSEGRRVGVAASRKVYECFCGDEAAGGGDGGLEEEEW